MVPLDVCVCVQAQKELLDAELDFHKRMSSGEDTTDLKRKLGQLQVEVMNAHTQFKMPLRLRLISRLHLWYHVQAYSSDLACLQLVCSSSSCSQRSTKWSLC